MLYHCDFGEQVEKRFWFALSDLILVFQIDCLVFVNKKKGFVLCWAKSSCCVRPPTPDRSFCTTFAFGLFSWRQRPGMLHELFNKFSARKHWSRIGNIFPSLREEGNVQSWLCLLYFILKLFLFIRGQNQSLVKYSIMETPWRRHVFACSFKQSRTRCRYFAFYAFADGGKLFLWC